MALDVATTKICPKCKTELHPTTIYHNGKTFTLLACDSCGKMYTERFFERKPDGWSTLEHEVESEFGDYFEINRANCKTCRHRENIVTHLFADTTCGWFVDLGCFSLKPDYVKFTMIHGCPHWEWGEEHG